METVLNVLLIRFGIIAGVVVVLGLAVFAVVVALRRRGQGDRVRAGAAAVARCAGRAMDQRGGRGRAGGRAARKAVRWLEDDRRRDAR
ncbi:hypothetical protein [Amycolatopsis jiangsuensis]|uniref:Uncharacterized protein n=1 Tax=Amycolatopsis jiangsuensis TaxID=1181879 RepID=A0A840IQZ5_9PSEU|nr:hypothetical protein [Amycolatopsis jiangsuensis]MBB4684253.1 hypothetical protein [Amycolatopsis jiangsuensis]